jgi:hypothetical protein
MKASLTAVLFVLALGGAAAAAQTTASAPASPPAAAPHMKFKEACSADVQKLCATAQTRKEQKKCIKENKSQLSPSCTSFLAEKREEHKAKKEEKAESSSGASSSSTMSSPPATPGH